MRRPLVALIGGGLLLAAATGWSAVGRHGATLATANPAADPAATPSGGALARPVGIGAIGRIEPRSRVLDLASPRGAGGTPLRRILVGEGDLVEAGAVLAEYADLDLRRAAAAAARARLQQAMRESERVAAGPPEEELAVRDAAIRVLSLDRSLAQRIAHRARAAWRDDATSASELDARTADALRAEALVIEEMRRRDALAFVDPLDLAAALAGVESAAAEVEQAERDFELSLLRAPVAGRVLAIHAHAGEAPGDGAVLSLADTSAMDVVVEVYESDIGRVAEGMRVTVSLPWTEATEDGPVLLGTVREIGWRVGRRRLDDPDPVAQDDVRVVEVRATLDAPSARRVERMTGLRVRARLEPADAGGPQAAGESGRGSRTVP